MHAVEEFCSVQTISYVSSSVLKLWRRIVYLVLKVTGMSGFRPLSEL